MSEQIENSSLNTGLSIRLEKFSGPMDLLLHLVNEAKIEIRDIFVSEVTYQFLEYVKRDADIDRSSEYLEIAAALLEIKSRSLLPVQDKENSETSEKEFILRLEEYKLFKEAGEKLKEMEETGRFFKRPDQMAARYAAGEIKLDGLLDAFVRLMHRIGDRGESDVKEVVKDVFTVKERIHYIQECFMLSDRISFFSIFSDKPDKTEIIITFSALLELTKVRYIGIEQSGLFGDIVLYKNSSYAGNQTFTEDIGL